MVEASSLKNSYIKGIMYLSTSHDLFAHLDRPSLGNQQSSTYHDDATLEITLGFFWGQA